MEKTILHLISISSVSSLFLETVFVPIVDYVSVISDVDILEVATAIPNQVEGIHGDMQLNRPDVLECE